MLRCVRWLTLWAAAPPLFCADFYVAPAGSDANPGTLEKLFAGLERARDAVWAA